MIQPGQIVGEFLARQKLVGTFGAQVVRFEAALQKRGETLTVVGLTPLGNKAFTLVQEGDQLRFENLLPKGQQVPLEPEFLLADIHHAFFLRADPASPEVAGWRRATHGKEYVYEEQVGEDMHISFKHHPGSERQVEVRQSGGHVGGFPRRVSLDNGYYGYQLQIETVAFQRLE